MATNSYIVKNGDTQWGISAKHLGSAHEWPRLWKHNNRKDIVASTGRAISNPDLIYPGQKIALPINTFQKNQQNIAIPRRINKPNKTGSLQQQLTKIKTPIAMQYNLKDIVMPPMITPNAIVEVKMTGNVILTSKQNFPITYVTNKDELEAKITHRANTALGALISDIGVNFDTKTGKVKLAMNLIAKSNTPNIPTTSVGIIADSNAPIPKIKYEIKLPELKGSIGDFNFVAANITIALELTPTGRESRRDTEKSTNISLKDSSIFTPKVIAGGLVVTATLIIVGTLVEDFLTAGAGIADDPACFATAAAMYARSAALWRGTTVVAQKALLPVTKRLTVSVIPTSTVVYAH